MSWRENCFELLKGKKWRATRPSGFVRPIHHIQSCLLRAKNRNKSVKPPTYSFFKKVLIFSHFSWKLIKTNVRFEKTTYQVFSDLVSNIFPTVCRIKSIALITWHKMFHKWSYKIYTNGPFIVYFHENFAHQTYLHGNHEASSKGLFHLESL